MGIGMVVIKVLVRFRVFFEDIVVRRFILKLVWLLVGFFFLWVVRLRVLLIFCWFLVRVYFDVLLVGFF